MVNFVSLCDINYGFVPKNSTDLFVKPKIHKVGLALHPKLCSLTIIYFVLSLKLLSLASQQRRCNH